MTDSEWLTFQSPEQMLPLVQERVSEQKLRLFACACCRRVWHLLAEENREIIEAAEQYARGRISRDELAAAAEIVKGADPEAERRAAEEHLASARYEAATAAWQCATLPPADAAWFVSRCAAAAIADEAEPDPASDPWRAAERAERAAQAQLLRELIGLERADLKALTQDAAH
jgi:hypothetical protein